MKKKKVIISEYNLHVMQSMIKQYGKEKAKDVYYATANKNDLNPETFEKS